MPQVRHALCDGGGASPSHVRETPGKDGKKYEGLGDRVEEDEAACLRGDA